MHAFSNSSATYSQQMRTAMSRDTRRYTRPFEPEMAIEPEWSSFAFLNMLRLHAALAASRETRIRTR